MIYLLVFRGANQTAVNNGVERAKQVANGFFLLGRGVAPTVSSVTPTTLMLIQSATSTMALRNFLGNPLTQVAVIRIAREWATLGVEDLTQWLHQMNDLF